MVKTKTVYICLRTAIAVVVCVYLDRPLFLCMCITRFVSVYVYVAVSVYDDMCVTVCVYVAVDVSVDVSYRGPGVAHVCVHASVNKSPYMPLFWYRARDVYM